MEATSQVLTVRMPQESFARLTKLAEQEKRPLAQMSRILLDEALDARTKRTKKTQ